MGDFGSEVRVWGISSSEVRVWGISGSEFRVWGISGTRLLMVLDDWRIDLGLSQGFGAVPGKRSRRLRV